MMPPQLLIIADDLTGANDTGVQFAKQGMEVLVSLWPDQDLQSFASDCQVLVVNTESRHLKAEDAFQRVYKVAAKGVEFGIPQFYKKTDSTLRGNLGSELAALFAATGEHQLFFAPAYPKLHRTTRGGVQFVNGLPLHQTPFVADPLNPVHEASIAAIIAQQTNTAVIAFDALASETSANAIVIVDAETDEDLRRAAHLLKGKKLLAGSAGLAEFLPAMMSLPSKPVTTPTLSLPMLVVNGSLHETSRQQIAHAAQHGWAVVEMTSELSADQVIERLKLQPQVVITTSAKLSDELITNRMAAMIAQIFSQITIPVVAVFGGDTLAAIAQACDWKAFRLCAEFLPGVPLARVCGRDDVLLLTKAGGFGCVELISLLQG